MTKEQAEQVLQLFVKYCIETEYEGYVSMDLKGTIYEIEDLDFTPYQVFSEDDDDDFLDFQLLAKSALDTLKN